MQIMYILGVILCRTLAINVVCEKSCKRYAAFQSLPTSISYFGKFLHCNTSSQPLGQDSSLKHFLLFGQAFFSTALLHVAI
jgi:hypothetical protein